MTAERTRRSACSLAGIPERQHQTYYDKPTGHRRGDDKTWVAIAVGKDSGYDAASIEHSICQRLFLHDETLAELGRNDFEGI